MGAKKSKNVEGKLVDMLLKKVSLNKIQRLAKQGIPTDRIAESLEVSPSYFIQLRKKHPKLQAAFQKGRSDGLGICLDVLWEMVNDKSCPDRFKAVVLLASRSFYYQERKDTTNENEDVSINDVSFVKHD